MGNVSNRADTKQKKGFFIEEKDDPDILLNENHITQIELAEIVGRDEANEIVIYALANGFPDAETKLIGSKNYSK